MEATRLEPFLLLAKSAKGRAAAEIVHKTIAEPGVIAFGELLEAPGVRELQSTELSAAYSLLQLFCYGTWADYKGNSSQLPELNGQQQLKLKQLTVVSMAGTSKKLRYADLMLQLEVQNVRELEDFLISNCFYSGLVAGKLDQRERCLHVEEVAARDVRPEDLQSIVGGLAIWLQTSQTVLEQLETSREGVQDAVAAIKEHQAAVEAKLEAAKKALKSGEGGSKDIDMLEDTGTLDMMEMEDRSGPPPIGGRSKRRR